MGSSGGGRVCAAVDIGSNSIKLRVGRCAARRVQVLLDTTEVVRLGSCLRDGAIPEETMHNAARVVAEMVGRARRMGAEPCLVGTMALRVAVNAHEFLSLVRRRTGLEVRILSGEEEASYSWKGASADFARNGGNLVLFDTGGGSTEFVFGRRGAIERIQSVPVGAVSLTERFFAEDPPSGAALDEAMACVREVLSANGIVRVHPGAAPAVLGLGGGAVAIGSVKDGSPAFIPTRLHGMMLTRKDVAEQMALYSSLPLAERRRIVGLPASRADIVLGSACIILGALRALDVESFTLSINGLRHGVLLERCEGLCSEV